MTHLLQPISYRDPLAPTNQLPWPTCSNQSATVTHLLQSNSHNEPAHAISTCSWNFRVWSLVLETVLVILLKKVKFHLLCIALCLLLQIGLYKAKYFTISILLAFHQLLETILLHWSSVYYCQIWSEEFLLNWELKFAFYVDEHKPFCFSVLNLNFCMSWAWEGFCCGSMCLYVYDLCHQHGKVFAVGLYLSFRVSVTCEWCDRSAENLL